MAVWFAYPSVVGDGTRESCVGAILADLEDFTTTDADGNTTFDVEGFMVVAAERLAAIPDPGGASEWGTPQLLRGMNVRPYAEKLRDDIEALAGASGSQGTTDLTSLLADCQVKSEAVTAYYNKLYNVDLPATLAVWYGNGELEGVVPPVDDLSTETRYYRTTFVTDWEEESAPSEVSDAIEVGSKDTVTITRGTVPSGRNISYWRPYRSNSGSEAAAFQYVPNDSSDLGVAIATSTFEDEVPNSELQEVCPSTIWAEPPADLNGVIAMANGIHLGFFDRTLCPSESYVPYAWPIEYQRTVQDEIVGLCAWDQAAFVATKGNPYFVTGADAASLTLTKLEGNQACVSARSICATKAGVVYASPDGLCLAVPGAPVQVITEGHFTREEWQALDLANIIVQEHDGVLYWTFDTTPEVDSDYTWHPYAQQYVTWSESNTVMTWDVASTGSGNSRGARTVTAITGKKCCEFTWDNVDNNMPGGFGVTTTSSPAAGFTGAGTWGNFSFDNADGGPWTGGCGLPGGGAYSNGSANGSIGYNFVAGDVISIAFDNGTGKLWVAKNGVWIGDPTAGTGQLLTLSVGPTYYFHGGLYSCNTGSGTPEIVVDPMCSTYGAPSGFSTYQPT